MRAGYLYSLPVTSYWAEGDRWALDVRRWGGWVRSRRGVGAASVAIWLAGSITTRRPRSEAGEISSARSRTPRC